MKTRIEAWGAWVRIDHPPALVAIDRNGALALGIDGASAWIDTSCPPPPSAPIEVHLAVTSRCAAGCQGCYLDARPDGIEPNRETILAAFDALRDAGVFTVAFGGGEPTTRADLDVLAFEARARGLLPVLTTSGIGLSPQKIARLRDFAQVNVSYDGEGDDYRDVRGFSGAAAAEDAIARLADAGVRVGVNVVLTRSTYARLGATIHRARSVGAVEAQLLRYKPAGRAASLDYLARRLTSAQASALGPTLRAIYAELPASPSFSLRIDCALVPFLVADPAFVGREDELSKLGIFGCEAGGALAAVKVDGRVAPCSFAEASTLPVARLAEDHAADVALTRFRDFVAAPPEPCASCTFRHVCKGGCKVVATFMDGAFGPDPECPRVMAYREGVVP